MADDPSYSRRAALDNAMVMAEPDRDSWGTDAAAQAAAREMMAAGARPRRPKPEVPPTP